MEIRLIRPQELNGLLELYRYLHSEDWLEDGPQARQIWEAIENMQVTPLLWRRRGESCSPPVHCFCAQPDPRRQALWLD